MGALAFTYAVLGLLVAHANWRNHVAMVASHWGNGANVAGVAPRRLRHANSGARGRRAACRPSFLYVDKAARLPGQRRAVPVSGSS